MTLRDRTILLIAPEIINPRAMPCVGLGYIGAYLDAAGIDVRIVDCQFTKEDPEPVLRATPPTLVGIGVDSRTYPRGLRIAALAKRYGHTTLLGGLHVSLVRAAALEHPAVDYAISGDGEIPTARLIDALDGRIGLADVPGLIYRDGGSGGVRVNPNDAEIQDLATLPFPDYRLAGIDRFPLYPLVTSRDCPYRCTYCTVGNISHGRFRSRSPADSVEELLVAKERYGVRGFLVVDENFSFQVDRAVAFCEELIARDVNLPWSAFEGMRADCLVRNPEILDLLKRSGCRWIFFGIESAENAILKVVRKGQKFQVIEEATRLARAAGFKVGGFFIVGLPDATYERDLLTVHWAAENLDGATFWMSIPYYNTGLYQWALTNARLLRQPVGDNIVNSLSTMPFYETDAYPAGLVKKAHTIGNLRTGVDYFFEHIDREAARRARAPAGPSSRRRRRQLIQHVVRYDPSFLPRIVDGAGDSPYPDPVQAAVDAARAGADFTPLPADVARAAAATSRMLPVVDAG